MNEEIEYLGIPFFSDDLYLLLLRFLVNLIFISIIIRQLYYRYTQKTQYVFAYFMVGIIVFFLCFTLRKFTLDIGMALGLFAIFGIIRYRTQTVEIKEMTYLFVVIGVSVINALASVNMSHAELLGTNLIIVAAIFIIEYFMLTNRGVRERSVVYDDLENIKPEKYNLLVKDLSEKTGLNVKKIKINKVDFANKVASITLYYSPINGDG